ncbi:hypothetical protein GCM10023169_02770 [Georgenia halophila]|uniref:NifU family protein n=1 Tax=Georgenia halophila TaxID=620889 RepID=A0ABP8KT75_9MICO
MSETTDGATAVDDALEKFRDMLANDGYLLRWSTSEQDAVVVTIEAGDDACEDCLVPQSVMEAMMSEALKPTPYRLDHVVLPAEH